MANSKFVLSATPTIVAGLTDDAQYIFQNRTSRTLFITQGTAADGEAALVVEPLGFVTVTKVEDENTYAWVDRVRPGEVLHLAIAESV